MAKQWFPCYWGDYVRDTADLTLIEHGAYWMMLGHLYTSRRPLPTDPSLIYRIAGAHDSAERAAVDRVLIKFWTRIEDGYIQARAMREIHKSTVLETRASRGGHARWGDKDQLELGSSSSLVDAKTMPPHPHPHPHPETTATTTRSKNGRAFALPDWLDETAWSSWERYRAELKKPLKPSTVKSQMKFLHEHQQDHIAIIEQSIRNGWQGLFELKSGTSGVSARRDRGQSEAERFARSRK